MSILNDPPAAPTESVGSPEGNTAAAPTTPTTSWRDSLPEDMRSEKSFETIPGTTVEEALPNLAKQYLNAQQMVGADKLVIPGENATPEQTNEFFTKLGRPAEAKDYEMVLPEGLDESTLDTAQIDKWKDRFHEAGISAKVAKEFLSQHISEEFARNQQAQQGAADQLQSWELEAKETFGDKFDETANLARYALKEAGSPELMELLNNTGLANNPHLIGTLAKLGAAITEETAKGGGSTGFNSNTAEGAQAQLVQFNRNPDLQKALHDRADSNHTFAVEERKRLFLLAYPDEAPAG